MQSTSVRIDASTHSELKRLANERGESVGNTVAIAVRRLRQDLIGSRLNSGLVREETHWLDADPG